MTVDIIEPLIPGEHIEGWQKIRKGQWKFVKKVLTQKFGVRGEYVDECKDLYFNYYSFHEDEYTEPFELAPTPFLEFWFCPDQSVDSWNKLWRAFQEEYAVCTDYKKQQQRFFDVANACLYDEKTYRAIPYGTFGGLEQRMLDLFLRSKTYTDEMITLAGKDYRIVPWEEPEIACGAMFSHMSDPCRHVTYDFDDQPNPFMAVSPFSPYQWLHEFLISTFECDLSADHEYMTQTALIEYFKMLKRSLFDETQELVLPNHLQSMHKLIDIVEDDMTPKFIRDVWKKVRDDSSLK